MSSLSDRGFVVDRAVFVPSIVFLLSTVGVVLLFPDASSSAFGALQAAIIENASWFYGLVMAILLITSGVLAFSRVGQFKVCETIIDLNESYQDLVRKKKAA